MKRILITGGAGFIGSALVNEIAEESNGNTKITVLDNFRPGRPERLRKFMKSGFFSLIKGDVCDKKGWAGLGYFDEIYHLADILGTLRVAKNPTAVIKTAVEGASLAAAHASATDAKFFYASTSMVYGPKDPFTKEGAELSLGTHPVWAYAAAKICGEHIVREQMTKNGLRAIIGRFFNIVGPHQDPASNHVIAVFFRRAIANQALEIYGNGAQQRSFTHVKDAVRAVRLLTEMAGEISPEDSTVNISSGTSQITINEAAEKIIGITGFSKSNIPPDFRRIDLKEKYQGNYEDMRNRYPDTDRLERLLSNCPEWNPEKDVNTIFQSIYNDLMDARKNNEQ